MFQFKFVSGSFENNPNLGDSTLNIKKIQRTKLIKWIVRQLYIGFFIWLFRDKSWIDIVIGLWVFFSVLNLLGIIFIYKFMSKLTGNFNPPNNQSNSSSKDDEFADVEILE